MTDARTVHAALAGDYARRYPGEVAALLEEQPAGEVASVFGREPMSVAGPVFAAFTPAAGARLLTELPEERAAALLGALDPARAAVLCATFDTDRRRRLLERLPVAAARELQELMSYPSDTAAGLMTARVETFRPDTAAGAVLARLRAARVEGVTDVVLVEPEGYLAGMAGVAALAAADPDTPAAELAHRDVVTLPAMTPREEVVDLMKRTRVSVQPVVDPMGRLLGVVRHDQLVRAVEENASVGVQTMVGAGEEEQALSPVGFAVRKRLPWLQINLLTAFLAAAVVGLFEETIARVTALAVLLPVVAGQSGNTGSQALAVTIRGLALREVRLRNWRRVSVKEGAVGLINGVAVALTTSLGVYVWSRSLGLTLVIATSMVLSMVVAGLAGAVIPMGLVAARQDPAQSSSIVLTTVTDIVGFFSFLGVATLLMDWL